MIQFDFTNRTAVVTGGAKGIGLGIAQNLANAGATVVIWDENANVQLDDAPWSFALATDVADPESVTHAAEMTLERFGCADILVNNAGVNGPTVPTWEYPLDGWQRVIDIDLTGVFLCCRALVPAMRENGYGRIVNVASICGQGGECQWFCLLCRQSGGDRLD